MILKDKSKTMAQKNFWQERGEVIFEGELSFDHGMN